MSGLGWIRQFHKPTADLPPLLIFPHAGSGASAYRSVSQSLCTEFDVALVQYPGRQDRAAEAPAATLGELAAGAWESYRSAPQFRAGPLTVFGHSMGAVVAFEFVRLAEAAGHPVRLLAPSASVAPSQVAALPPHPESDQELTEHLSALGGTGAGVLASPAMLKLALPVMRMDYQAFDRYSCAPGVSVNAPVHVLGGDGDPAIGPGELYGWAKHTTGGAQVTVFGGGHFYFQEQPVPLAAVLAAPAAAPVR